MTQAQTQQRPATHEEAVADEARKLMQELIAKDYKQLVEYTPFLADEAEKVKLTPATVIKYFCKPTKEGYVCTDEQAVKFMKLCHARKLNPWEGDAYLVGYDNKDGPEFNLITAHQAFAKRAEAHPKYQGMESGVVVMLEETEEIKDIEGDFVPPGCTLVGGWARVHREDRKIPTYRRVPLAAFRKSFGVWNSNAGGMICKCAEADGFRSAFPNSLGGMYIENEMAAAETAAPAKMNLRQQAAQTTGGEPQGTASQTSPGATIAPPVSTPSLQGTGGAVPNNPSVTTTTAATNGGSTGSARPRAKRSNATAETGPAGIEGGAAQQAAPSPATRTGVVNCVSCGHPTAGGKCPHCGAEAQPRQHEPSQGVKDAEAAQPAPVDDPQAANDEIAAEEYAALDLDQLRNHLKVAGISSNKAVVARAKKAKSEAGFAMVDEATEDQVRGAARVYRILELAENRKAAK